MGLIINKNAESARRSASDWGGKSVLIIDDFRNFRSVIGSMMRSFGVTDIAQAASGEAALRMLADKRYDIILCDYNLGQGKDGQQVLEEGKHRGFITAGTVFIMVTAENTVNMVLGAIEYVPDDYLVKPFTSGVLNSRLGQLLRKKEEFAGIQRALDSKEYETVLNLCDRGIEANPTSPYDFLRIKADVLVATGQYDRARVLYKDVLQQRTILWALMGLGRIHFFLKQYAEARDVFQDVVSRNRMLMEAYDWLAKSQAELDQIPEAQQTLMAATSLSPKVVGRQRALGEVAYRNNDLDVAARSFRSAISVGRNSCFKGPSEYMGLAKVLVDTDSGGDALQLVTEARQEFKDDPLALMQSAAVEGLVYNKLGDPERAARAIEEAYRYYSEAASAVSPQAAMDLARACFSAGAAEKGSRLMQELIKNNHEDERLLKDVQKVFQDANLAAEGARLIDSTRREMVGLNNRGVELVKEGKLEEAIAYFEKAAEAMTASKIINANAAYALLLRMKRDGRSDALLSKAQYYLDRALSIDPHYKKGHDLLPLLRELRGGNKP